MTVGEDGRFRQEFRHWATRMPYLPSLHRLHPLEVSLLQDNEESRGTVLESQGLRRREAFVSKLLTCNVGSDFLEQGAATRTY